MAVDPALAGMGFSSVPVTPLVPTRRQPHVVVVPRVKPDPTLANLGRLEPAEFRPTPHVDSGEGDPTLAHMGYSEPTSPLSHNVRAALRSPDVDSDPKAPLSFGSGLYGQPSQRVMDLQRELKSMGYDLGHYGSAGDGVDGRLGKMTLAALKQAQTKLGFKPTGTADPDFLSKLQKANPNPANPNPDAAPKATEPGAGVTNPDPALAGMGFSDGRQVTPGPIVTGSAADKPDPTLAGMGYSDGRQVTPGPTVTSPTVAGAADKPDPALAGMGFSQTTT